MMSTKVAVQGLPEWSEAALGNHTLMARGLLDAKIE